MVAGQQRLQPSLRDLRRAEACSCQGAGDGRVGVRVATQVRGRDDRLLEGVRREGGPEGHSKSGQDEADLALHRLQQLLGGQSLGVRDHLPDL